MPELPEVETVRRGLEPAMVGKKVVRIEAHREGLRVPFPPAIKNLEGRVVAELTRRAKYLLIKFEGEDPEVLVMHLGMSGRMTVVPDMAVYDRQKHDHLTITMEGGEGVVFNDARRFGMIFMVKESGLDNHPALKILGPEPLVKDFTGKVLLQKLAGKSTPIKLSLLDQSVVSGIGNIYACEALFAAGVDPRKKSYSVTVTQAEDLAKHIKEVLERSIKAGGSSLKDYRKSDGSLGDFQHSFMVYDKEGEPCPHCPSSGKKKPVIHKITQGGRSTFFCPNCQK